MSSVSASVKKMSSQVSKSYSKHMLKNKNVNFGVIGLLVLLVVLTPVMPNNVLSLLKSNVVRVVMIVAICLICLVDPIKALLLAILFVVAVQKLNSSKLVAEVPVPVDSVPEPVKVEEQPVDVSPEENKILNLSGNNLNNVVDVNNIDLENINDVDAAPSNNLNNVVDNNVDNVDNVVSLNDISNNVQNELANNVANNVAANNIANNVVLNDVANNVAVNNVANNVVNEVLGNNVAVNNVANNVVSEVVGNDVVGNNVNDLELNNLSNLSNNMNVLSEADNIAADIIGVNNRKARGHEAINGYNSDELINANKIGSNLLMDGTPGYELVSDDKLTGKYSDGILPSSNMALNMAPLEPANNNVAANNVAVDHAAVGANNTNNLIEKNPFPGNNLNLVKPHVEATLDVSGFNSLANKYHQVGGVLKEGFQSQNDVNTVSNTVEEKEVVVPQNLLFTTPEQLKKAQDRSITCDGKPNNAPIKSADVMHSAQGYGNEITGYNKYGASAINYLCVDK